VGRSFSFALVFAVTGCTVLTGADRFEARDTPEKKIFSSDDASTSEDSAVPPPSVEAGTDAAVDAGADAGTPPPAGSLVARWAFDEGSGTTVGDSSGKGHDGTTSGGLWVAGRPGRGSAYELDGTDDHVDVAAHADFNRVANPMMTLTAWARRLETMNHDMFFSVSYGGDDQSFGIEIRTDTMLGYFDGNTHAAEATVNIPNGAWHHYAVVIDGTQTRIYLDGVKVSEGAADATPRTSVGVILGGSSYGDRYKGVIDDMRVYRATLDDAQIAWDRDH
jgi:hypothetical protein